MGKITAGLKLILLFLATQAFAMQSQTLSVLDFGATGNGTTDDTAAINSCFTAAKSASKNVYFPFGHYLCNTNDVNGRILIFDVSGLDNITVYGDPGTVITTSDTNATNGVGSVLMYVLATSKDTNLIISNLTFISTHGITQKQTTALFLQGVTGQNLYFTQVYNCKFDGFGTTVGVQGCYRPTFILDTFYALHGHDCGQHGLTNPVPFLTFYDNGTGRDSMIDVERCVANGYTGPIPMNCPRPADNFVYGTGYGYTITQNQTKFLSQEHFSISPQNTFPVNNASNNIYNNYVDQSLPVGSVEDNGTPHKFCYGMRIDAGNSYIQNNTFKNYSNGLLVYEVLNTTYQPNNLNIFNNTFIAHNAGDTLYQTIKAIAVTGYSGHPYTNVTMSNNTTAQVDTVPYILTNVTTPVQANNKYSKVLIPN
jgi:hypothetical protein